MEVDDCFHSPTVTGRWVLDLTGIINVDADNWTVGYLSYRRTTTVVTYPLRLAGTRLCKFEFQNGVFDSARLSRTS